MATVDKAFRIKNGLVVEGSTATVNGSNVLTEASTEFIQDTAASLLTSGTHSGITFTYDDSGNAINASVSSTPTFSTEIVFEGPTADSFETTLNVVDPTADRTITLPNVSGTVITTGDSGTVTNTMLAGSIANDKLSNSAITINGTSVSLGGSRTLGTDDVSEGSTNKYFTDERAQDAVGNNLGTGLSYNDTSGAISVTANTYDAYGAAASAQTAAESTASGYVSTHAGLTSTHGVTGSIVGTSDTQTLTNKTISGSDNTISNIGNSSLTNSAITINGTSTSLGGTRTLGTDDISEGSTNKYFTDERAQDAVAQAIANGTHTNISITYNDSANSLSFNSSGGVSSLAGTANEVEVSSSTGAVTIGLPDSVTITSHLTVGGDLTVNGTTTTINSTTVSVDDKNIELASTASPSDASADGAGITVKGTTDKTFNWVDATDSWTSSEHLNLASGKSYYANGTALKDVTETLTNKSISGSANTLTNIPNNALSNSAITINGTSVSLGGTRTLGSDDIAEGSTNKYFTDERAQDAIGLNLGTGLSYNDTSGAISVDTTAIQAKVSGVSDTEIGYLDGVTSGIQTQLDAKAALISPSFTTPNIGAATATSITLTDALIGTATQALTDNTATVIDSWSASTYSSAKYIVQMKNGSDIEVLEVLVTVSGDNNVYITEYADVQSNAQIGTTDADYSGGNVRLKVTASNGTTVKVHKTLIEA